MSMPTQPKWKPRGSALGYYAQCSMRALFDRAVHEGSIELTAEELAAVAEARKSSPYADLGTAIHYYTQCRLNATFPGDPDKYIPTPDQLLNAATLFSKDQDKLSGQIKAAAALGAAAIGPGTWKAEVKVSRPWVSGHIDLVDETAGVLVDIKTTSRPPVHTTLSPTHLIQTLAYVIAYEEQFPKLPRINKVRVVYVDSLKASWWTQCEYDPASEAMVEYRGMIVREAKRLRSKTLYVTAQPNFASCEWCPYTTLCRDRYAVPRGDVHRLPLAPTIKASNPLAPLAGKVLNPQGWPV